MMVAGTRVRCVEGAHVGSVGTVVSVNKHGVVFVKYDDTPGQITATTSTRVAVMLSALCRLCGKASVHARAARLCDVCVKRVSKLR